MGERYDIGVDIGEEKDKSIATLFKIGENGEYRPIAVCDSINFGDSVQRSGYVGVEAGEYTFSAEVVNVSYCALRELFGLDFVRDMTSKLPIEITEEHIKIINRFMEEKKTKKMTKAEAFEWLKCKKVDASYDECSVQSKLFSLGVIWWSTLNTNPCPSVNYLLIDKECHMSHCGSDLDFYKSHCYEEISAEDILSIEIVDDEKKSKEENELDKISCLGAQIVDILLRMKGHHHVIITETTVSLYDEGMCLFHDNPF